MMLNDGMEEIGKGESENCFSLEAIEIPNTIKRIQDGVYRWCERLTAVRRGDGLEEIDRRDFYKCALLEHIASYPTPSNG